MAMGYEQFNTYPIQILGINESYNDELNAIENEIINEMGYSGNVADLSSVLPYFVFFKFCDYHSSQVSANNGESYQTQEYTTPSMVAQVRVWNMGVKMLASICETNGATVNEIYTSERILI
jgi:hypothetical protein